ncbi:MAG: Glycosyl transferase group 1 [Candidatus Falkowbacteria bacterium GW2011_GWC2_38_22]|nr:MAG: Glycosyl transferase group 1 [Candidatus Falkowbacteria bacterium GW2011_GWF2_38_1205]KKQ60602.1 MAG: Glycosyl transferase group 1 [Candidatus Falkowbacteria bacterium GW2011_GWC2_38_22]KKQ62693.1 MAG: Glycosyl transferase group 1 [Candidatus Falkowbacteria bacterium GW2011_GWF1_38_22]KKQ64820.1 MAG: Glycosyl transferase group 1 [Candidatus Falkowbacteria bacterium GW2011_GWE2_38_254]KKQ72062.1 MAG: Glycosyl transferase group 1 [Candidatus Falkowbacteria bacterium GW2011_GWD2_38_42]
MGALLNKMPKKILIATGIFPPDIGGPATYVETLLNELPKRGFEVRVVTYANDGLEIRNYNLEIIKISRNQNILLRYLKYFIQIYKLLSWSDIVYIQDPISAGIPAALACKLRGKKYYMKIVGDYAWEQGRQKYGVADNLDEFQNKKYSNPVERLRRLQKFTAGSAEKIITPSNYLKTIVTAWGIDSGKTQVIYNSVRPAQTMKSKAELRQELELSGDIIVSVGRLVPWKGFDTLIDLMPELLKINPDFKLLIIGEGKEIKNYELRIKNYELEKNVFLLGALEQKKLWEYMKASDFFVLNTGYEGLPHIVIEAMYLDLPVITTYAGGNTEVVRHGDNGTLVEYNNRDQIRNAILKLWKDKEVRDMLVLNAKRDLNRFGTERMVDGVVKVF